jgi:tetratricopeptide (TPR) repeat protein
LKSAIEGGDPNIINKVLSEFLKKTNNLNNALQLVASIPDGIRHLRNYAKKKKDDIILAEIAALNTGVPNNSNVKPNDYFIVV